MMAGRTQRNDFKLAVFAISILVMILACRPIAIGTWEGSFEWQVIVP